MFILRIPVTFTSDSGFLLPLMSDNNNYLPATIKIPEK